MRNGCRVFFFCKCPKGLRIGESRNHTVVLKKTNVKVYVKTIPYFCSVLCGRNEPATLKNQTFYNNMSIKGTKTEKNLMHSFAGESQARMRYTYFASAAKKEGYEQMAAIFTETAEQEKEHAKRMFKYLEGGNVEITACFPAGVIGTTIENLKAAAMGEHEEWADAYPHFAEVAASEGFADIAAMYRNIAIAEKGHEERYLALVKNLENGEVFKKQEPIVWQCRNCGFIHEGTDAPKVCPACQHPQAYFEEMKNNI